MASSLTFSSQLQIESVTARAVIAPLPRPVRTAVGDVTDAPIVLIDLRTSAGIVGRAYIFAYTSTALLPLVKLIEAMAPDLIGRAVAPADCWRAFDRKFRLLGWQGLVGMAVSAIDMALWDALAKSMDAPVAVLLGGSTEPLQAYDSFGQIDLQADEKALSTSVESGFEAIKIKIGGRDLAYDLRIVAGVRSIIGPDIKLMVDYNQSLDSAEAARRIPRLAEFDLHWVEEPLKAEDLSGQARVRAMSPIPIQSGENWWFAADLAKAIAAEATDLAMLDLLRIGGVTGWLSAMAVAEAASLPVSSHIFVEASAHVLTVTQNRHWLEHLDLAGAILKEPCKPIEGKVRAKGPGLGIEWDDAAVDRFAA